LKSKKIEQIFPLSGPRRKEIYTRYFQGLIILSACKFAAARIGRLILLEVEKMDWTQLKAIVGISTAVLTGTIANVLGGWDMWLEMLVLFVVLDYISGLLAAFTEKNLNSEVGFKGVCKKVFIFILVAVAFSLDHLMGTQFIRMAVIGFYIGIEGLSILKNAGRSGLPIPEVLKNALEEIHQGKEGNTHG